MMKLRAVEDSSSGGRNKLPSISELDPAVSQAGRTQAPQYSHHHHPVAQVSGLGLGLELCPSLRARTSSRHCSVATRTRATSSPTS